MNILRIVFLLAVFFLVCLSAAPDAYAGGGGKGGGSAPAPAAPAPIPDTTPQEAESKAVRDDERRKLAQRGGLSKTVLTPLGGGGIGANSGNGNTLLGRIGK